MLFWTVSVMNRPFPSSSLPQVVLELGMLVGPLAFLRVYGVPWPWTQRLYFAMESVGSIRVEEAVRRRELLVYRALLQVVEPGPWHGRRLRAVWLTMSSNLPSFHGCLSPATPPAITDAKQGVLLMKMHSYIVTNRQLHVEVERGE
jgi:hypothetical protein